MHYVPLCPKKMQTNTQIIVHNAYQNTVQSAKVKQTNKKCNTNLVIASPKKQATTQGKTPTPTKHAYKTSACTIIQHSRKPDKQSCKNFCDKKFLLPLTRKKTTTTTTNKQTKQQQNTHTHTIRNKIKNKKQKNETKTPTLT